MYPTTSLQPGSTGGSVKQLQDFLVSQGFMTRAQVNTGYGTYGPQTTAAVNAWQKANGVDNSSGPGYWGPKSIAAASGGGSRNLSFSNDGTALSYSGNGQETTKPKTTTTTKTTTVQPNPTVVNTPTTKTAAQITKEIDDLVGQIVESVVASGKGINPNLTAEDLAELDPAEFLAQAEKSIAPEYKQKFEVAKTALSTGLADLGYDLNLKKEQIARETAENLDTGTEDLAGRGLAFSGQREKFVGDTAAAKTRAEESAATTAFRSAQEKVGTAEGLLGTEGVRSLLPSSFAGRNLSLSNEPLIGSLTSEKQYLKESMAKELEYQERQRRAYASRQLSFA
jgi:peptidoglycan hydrolase-like protein with peptidoglycan-binding domain